MCQHEVSPAKVQRLVEIRSALLGRNGVKRLGDGSPRERFLAEQGELVAFLIKHEGWCESEIDNRVMVIELRGAAALEHI